MQHLKEVGDYYEALAPVYDQDRFGNTYGQFIHQQEEEILQQFIGKPQGNELRLDLGCGTGRLLHFGTHGLDYSQAMIDEARKKHPTKVLQQGSALAIPHFTKKFSSVFSFHLLMHLAERDIPKVFTEVDRILDTKGVFVFDIPSAKRRQLTSYQAQNWHAAQSLSINDLKRILGGRWQVVDSQGVLFLPIHRFPNWLRQPVRWLDSLLCRSPWKEYASYLVIKIQKV
ncbi:class I SAM-dependent DNA methyltransferase [Lewinella cohaerens]|uniref:class I SAM-dependent DNA methyltransferase n=1 Tax=Lewinella cohaerens TaxID=70995 RepID=UPI00036DF713|nr:class I SAM-dependent methyltransferase [Lewinella cohaerens]